MGESRFGSLALVQPLGLARARVVAPAAAAQEPPAKDETKSVEGFGEARRGDVPEGTLEMMTPETDEAIKNGLAWLARTQNPDGSFGSGTYRGNIAVTSLAGLAFMSSGSSPGRGPYGAQIDKALVYVMDNTSPSGFIAVVAVVDARSDVFARLRHAVPGRGLRDDPSAGDPRKAPEGRPADHRHARTSRGAGGISRSGATPISR